MRYRLCTEPTSCAAAHTLAQLHLSAMLMHCDAAQPFAQLHNMSYRRPLHEKQKKKAEEQEALVMAPLVVRQTRLMQISVL